MRHTIIVSFAKKGKHIFWQYQNRHGVEVMFRPNSKGKAPKTLPGAKNSFHYYAKKKRIKKDHYSFALNMDGIFCAQESLMI